MTNYIKQLGIQDCVDRLEKRLGQDWFRSQFTRLEDALDPSDPDMQIILTLREKTREGTARRARRHDGTVRAGLRKRRKLIETQIKRGWTRKMIAEDAGVSPASLSSFLASDPQLYALYKQRGRSILPIWKIQEMIALHKAGLTNYKISKKLNLDHKTVARYLLNYKLGVIDV